MINREQIIKAENEIKRLHEKKEEIIKTKEEQLQKERRSLTNAIDEIRHSIRDREDKTQTETKAIENDYTKKAEPYNQILNEKKFLLECMRLQKQEIKLDLEVKARYYQERGKLLTPIDTILDDEYCKIHVYIARNDRPKNCYSLAIVGRNHLGPLMIGEARYYGNSVDVWGADIEYEPFHAPAEAEIKEWYGKSKHKILKEYLAEYAINKERYEKAIKETMTNEWQILYWEYQKDYYENHYCRGVETPEYKEAIKQLRKAKRIGKQLQAKELNE